MPARLANHRDRHLHTRSRHNATLDRVLQPGRRARCITHRRHSGIEGSLHTWNGFEQAQRGRRDKIARHVGIFHRQVNMTIDETGQDSAAPGIDYGCIAWDGDIAPQATNMLALDEQSNAALWLAATTVDQCPIRNGYRHHSTP